MRIYTCAYMCMYVLHLVDLDMSPLQTPYPMQLVYRLIANYLFLTGQSWIISRLLILQASTKFETVQGCLSYQGYACMCLLCWFHYSVNSDNVSKAFAINLAINLKSTRPKCVSRIFVDLVTVMSLDIQATATFVNKVCLIH